MKFLLESDMSFSKYTDVFRKAIEVDIYSI